MTDRTPSHLRLTALRRDAPTAFTYSPSPPEAEAIKHRLALTGLRKLRLRGEIAPVGRTDWQLTADLGATVVQPCSVSLEPVTTRIDEAVSRLYTRSYVAPGERDAAMPEDDTQEPLPDAISLAELTEEALSLAVPAFPRATDGDESAPFQAQAAPPGASPLDDDAARPSPFAALERLKRPSDDD